MKIICIGRNYVDHIDELKNDIPKNPIIFFKPSICKLEGSEFKIPDFSSDIHHEIEIIYKISKSGKNIPISDSINYISGIGLGIDFTARDLQQTLKQKGLPWEKAKAFDGSAVIGKWVSKRQFENLNNMSFSLKKNDTIVQSGNTKDMLWNIDGIISYVSQFFTLKIGDIIFTGTPSGVGPVQANDSLSGYIENEEFFNIKVK